VAIQSASSTGPAQLLQMTTALVTQQALYAAAKLGLADLLDGASREISELAAELNVNEPALLRIVRLLAGQGVFTEIAPKTFANNDVSQFLRTGVPGSVRALVVFRGSDFFLAPFGEILYSIETGLPAREKLYGRNAFEHLKDDPEMARIFDDAMTNMSELLAPAISRAYDFGAWGSLMDVGGGNGMLLAGILRAHPGLRGVLADLPHVLERARERGFLEGELKARAAMQPCDFFLEIPPGCRAYLMKSVIHDWNDEQALRILANCRRVVPEDGALLLAEWTLPDDNLPSVARFVDVAMLVLTGGKERSVDEYRELLARAGFRLNRVFPVPGDFSVIEALPV
jgi:SAM-dependent methyltransferase